MSLKTLSQLTSTTATDAAGAIGEAYRRNIVGAERIQELKQKIQSPDNVSFLAKTLLPEQTDTVAERNGLPRLSKETVVDRSLIDPAPDDWNFFGKPDAESYNLLLNSIIVEGLMNPITLWKRPTGRYMILSGHTRESVFDELYQASGDDKWLHIPAKYYEPDDLTENDARRIIILANIAQRAKETPRLRIRCYGEYARLTKERASYGSGIDINEEVAKVFGTHRSTVFFYRRVNNLIDPLLDRFCDGQLTRAAATVLCGLPVALQKHIVEKNYVKKMNRTQLQQLKTAKTIEEVDMIFASENGMALVLYEMVNLTVTMEKGEELFLLSMPQQDMERCRAAIKDALVNIEADLSEEGKAALQKQLERKEGVKRGTGSKVHYL